MRKYLDLLGFVLKNGYKSSNRTGVDTLAIFGTAVDFDLGIGFPVPTTKKFFFKSMAAELAGFLEGTTDAARMRELGTKIWDANANADYWQNNPNCSGEDDMGRIYGAQWRRWEGELDQLGGVVERIIKDPTDRRLIVTAWNPNELDMMCLPPCHMFYQFNVRPSGHLDCAFYMRSLDLFLGAPFDIASYALLTHIVAQQTDLIPGNVTMFIGNCHIYENHIPQVKEQLSRLPTVLPDLDLDDSATIDNFHPDMAKLINYDPQPAIKAEMAV